MKSNNVLRIAKFIGSKPLADEFSNELKLNLDNKFGYKGNNDQAIKIIKGLVERVIDGSLKVSTALKEIKEYAHNEIVEMFSKENQASLDMIEISKSKISLLDKEQKKY